MKNQIIKIRHSAAHLLAAAVSHLYPGVKIAIGPTVENGFYYDFDFPEKISELDLGKIEKEMANIARKNNRFEQKWIKITKAKEIFKDEPYKLEIISEIEKGEREDFDQKGKVSVYEFGDFIDLCRGPHVESAKEIAAFRILSIAGAYWHGNEKNKMLTRIYGTAFATKEELDKYLWQIEEAKKRDHRKLGHELDLFVTSENIGKGLPLLTPKGTILRNKILELENKLELENGFLPVVTPHIARSELYKKTGHWQHYRDVMYAPFGIEGEEYVLKPMNCPHHYMIYASKPRSYKDLPMRLCEPGTCYRFEKTGELSGLLRVRALSIDDSHILMMETQIENEFKRCIDMVKKMFKAFQLHNYYVRLSLADPSNAVKYISDSKVWKKAGKTLEKIVKNNKLEYKVAKGEASFYGPKLDFMINDSLGREWQMSTLQLDLFMGKRLGLTYTDEKGEQKNPVILHRGLTGSLERTMAILIEHFAGAFPLWLSPVQIAVLPVSEKGSEYAQKINKIFFENGLRSELNLENKTLGAKIRESTLQKIPYIVIIGQKEVENHKVNKVHKISIRTREGKDLGQVDIYQFIKSLKKQVETFQ